MWFWRRLRVESGRSGGVLEEQRSLGPAWYDFPASYPRGPVDRRTFVAVKAVADLTVAGRPLLWFDADRSTAWVDQTWFATGLDVVDATRIRPGERRDIGRAEPSLRRRMRPRTLAAFLLRAEVVRIYAHIGGHVRLEDERREGGTWVGCFRGEHVYFTNRKNVDPLAFEIRIDADGAMSVVGT